MKMINKYIYVIDDIHHYNRKEDCLIIQGTLAPEEMRKTIAAILYQWAETANAIERCIAMDIYHLLEILENFYSVVNVKNEHPHLFDKFVSIDEEDEEENDCYIELFSLWERADYADVSSRFSRNPLFEKALLNHGDGYMEKYELMNISRNASLDLIMDFCRKARKLYWFEQQLEAERYFQSIPLPPMRKFGPNALFKYSQRIENGKIIVDFEGIEECTKTQN